MYDFLEGRVVARLPARLVFQVGGIGYELTVPAGSPFPEGEPLKVHTHMVVREDSHQLYGFAQRSQRQMFRLLLRVQRVGPAMALAIVAGLDADQLLDILRTKDAARLARVKGVGKKTAERILLELSDRIEEFVAEEFSSPAPRPAAVAVRSAPVEDAVAALESIGFSQAEARRAVEAAAAAHPGSDLETLLRFALSG